MTAIGVDCTSILVLTVRLYFSSSLGGKKTCAFIHQEGGIKNFLRKLGKFNVHGSVHRNHIPIYIQQDVTLHSLFISGICSTCLSVLWLAYATHSTLKPVPTLP